MAYSTRLTSRINIVSMGGDAGDIIAALNRMVQNKVVVSTGVDADVVIGHKHDVMKTELTVEGMGNLIRTACCTVAAREDNVLTTLCAKGIFWMPELAYAYEVGKEVIKACVDRGMQDVKWRKEEKLEGCQGNVDMIIETATIETVVEFKMRESDEKYLPDVERLSRLLKTPQKGKPRIAFMVVLADPFSRNAPNDDRIARMLMRATHAGINMVRVGDMLSFPTKQDRYTTPIHCVIGVWQVLPQPLQI